MSPIRLTGSTSGYSQLDAPAIAGDQTFTLPTTGGTLDRINRAGNILQVVNATYSTETTSSSSTFADTGLTATITPTSASSKILVLINQAGCGKSSQTQAQGFALRLLRGSTPIASLEALAGYTNTTVFNYFGASSMCYLDSPATIAATTYKTQFAATANAALVYVQLANGGNLATSTITLIEVAA
jgi:hypothetical protein